MIVDTAAALEGDLRRAGKGGHVAGVMICIERQTLEAGRPVVVWPGRGALYAAYDPAQIAEEFALAAIRLLVPGGVGLASAGRGKDSSVEGIAKHGGGV